MGPAERSDRQHRFVAAPGLICTEGRVSGVNITRFPAPVLALAALGNRKADAAWGSGGAQLQYTTAGGGDREGVEPRCRGRRSGGRCMRTRLRGAGLSTTAP